jgi:hypothetical protein
MQMQCTEVAKQRDLRQNTFGPPTILLGVWAANLLASLGAAPAGIVASTFPQESGRVDALLGACCIAILTRRKARARSTGRSGSVQCARARGRQGAVQKMEADSRKEKDTRRVWPDHLTA